MSPVRTTGLGIFFVEEAQEPAAADLVARPLIHGVALALVVSRLRAAIMTCWARTLQVESDWIKPLISQFSCVLPSIVACGSKTFPVMGLAVAVGLVGPVLTGVQHEEVGQSPELAFAVKRHVRALREGSSAQRHELVVGLVGIHSPGEEGLGRNAVLLGYQVGVVVVEFMVVPGHQPGEESVRLP